MYLLEVFNVIICKGVRFISRIACITKYAAKKSI